MGLFRNAREFELFLQRQQEARKREVNADLGVVPAPAVGCEDELILHDEIMAHCNAQWPRWMFIRARSDQPSTIAAGVQDFTIFLPGGRVLCIECKSRTGKLSEEQRNWHHEMGRVGHHVQVVRSMEDFLAVVALGPV